MIEERYTRRLGMPLDGLYPMEDHPGLPADWRSYEPQSERDSVTALAERDGRDPLEWLYDYMLRYDGHSSLYYPMMSYGNGNLDAIGDMMMHPRTILGLADSGAHVGVMQDSANATFLLSYWVRDRERLTGRPGVSLEKAVRMHTAEPARVVGFLDRGLIQPGLKGDINVIDLDALEIHRPRIEHDLPTGAPRWQQWVSGYDMTIISGEVTFEKNVPTGRLPGRLVRNPRTQRVRDAGRVSELDLDALLARRGPAARDLIGRGDRGGADVAEGEVPPSEVRRLRQELVEEAKRRMLDDRHAMGSRL